MSPSSSARGWRPWTVFTLVTVPMLAPALASGWLLALTLSLDDVVVASFTSGPGASTLPMVVFSATRLGVTPEIYALATVILTAVAAILLAVSFRNHDTLGGAGMKLPHEGEAAGPEGA